GSFAMRRDRWLGEPSNEHPIDGRSVATHQERQRQAVDDSGQIPSRLAESCTFPVDEEESLGLNKDVVELDVSVDRAARAPRRADPRDRLCERGVAADLGADRVD